MEGGYKAATGLLSVQISGLSSEDSKNFMLNHMAPAMIRFQGMIQK